MADLIRTIKRCGCLAAIFDLDGVVTDTAHLHAHSWKTTFDKVIEYQTNKIGLNQQIIPFDLDKEYYGYLAGRGRMDSVNAFLASREFNLPLGEESDNSFESIYGIASYKNDLYIRSLEEQSINVYDDAVEFIYYLRSLGFKIGLATASKNSPLILRRTKLAGLFDTVVDGNDIQEQGLKPKPAAEAYSYAAEQLGFSLSDCVVFEDSYESLLSLQAAGTACTVGVAKNNFVQNKFNGIIIKSFMKGADVE